MRKWFSTVPRNPHTARASDQLYPVPQRSPTTASDARTGTQKHPPRAVKTTHDGCQKMNAQTQPWETRLFGPFFFHSFNIT